MIDCDRVFDVLTRGPFPTGGADDAAVEAHLAKCHDCARLAAALRPAIELFEEAVGPDEGHDLPSYWGEVAVESSERRAARADTAHQVRRRRIRRPLVHYSHAVGQLTNSNVWQVAALVALGVFIGSFVRGIAPAQVDRPRDGAAAAMASNAHNGKGPVPTSGTSNRTASTGATSTGTAGPVVAGDTMVLLPLACLGVAEHNNPDEAADDRSWVERRFVDLDRCCTRCHNATPEAAVPVSATASVQKSCRFCHVLN